MSNIKKNHVQMSKLLMKPFAYKTEDGKKVRYLAFEDVTIHEEKINTLGTLPGYYYDETEDFFGQEIEKNAGEVFTKWRQALNENLELRILDKDAHIVKRFVAYTFLRSEGLKEETKKSSFYLQFLNEKDQIQLVVGTPEHVLKYIDDFFVTVMANGSSVNFVIPHNCVYTVPCFEEAYKNEFFWCMPISPKYSVVLIPNTQKELYQDENKIDALYLEEDKEVAYMNHRALLTENTFSRKFIIGDEIKELERLELILKQFKKKESLENRRVET